MVTFENCEIFSTYYFSYVRGYKAALKGDNELYAKVTAFFDKPYT